jgi:hypothetical protein
MWTINQGGRLDAGMQRDDHYLRIAHWWRNHWLFHSTVIFHQLRSFKSHGDVVIQRRCNYIHVFVYFVWVFLTTKYMKKKLLAYDWWLYGIAGADPYVPYVLRYVLKHVLRSFLTCVWRYFLKHVLSFLPWYFLTYVLKHVLRSFLRYVWRHVKYQSVKMCST